MGKSMNGEKKSLGNAKAQPSVGPAYKRMLGEIRERIRTSQYAALQSVNREQIRLYWDIGRLIVAQQKGATWGKAVVQRLALDLRGDFPGIAGFSADNLWRMRKFYLHYAQKPKLAPLVQEIAWSHNIVILESCNDDLQREFYIRMTRKFGWSKNVLIHQIENKSCERTLSSQTNFDQALPPELRVQAKLAVKDAYTFDFLELGEEHAERELETALMLQVEKFLAEMGGLFAFVGRQFRIEIGRHEYFIDLLLYHRHLRCLVAVELKAREFEPEHVGKMQFYLTALDDLVRMPEENHSIGIIICKSKNRVIAEYALRDASRPIGVASYQIVSSLPKSLANQLPAPEKIIAMLERVDPSPKSPASSRTASQLPPPSNGSSSRF